MAQQTFKTTVVLVSTSSGTRVFRSVESIPAQVRKRLFASVARGGSATILIADRRGRRELIRAACGLPSSVRLRAPGRVRSRLRRLMLLWRDWIEIVLLGVAGSLLWFAATLD